jgi:uncharacterized protein YjbI with pentapeptide repeats
MVSPKRAAVKPRVVSPETREDVLLEDVIESHDAQGHFGVIELIGGPGSGKSAALAHLASLALADRILFVDDASPRDLEVGSTDRLVVYATRRSLKLTDSCYELVPWSTDDVIEYLLAMQPARCSSVVARLSADKDRGLLEGTPALLCLVAEQMAANDDMQSIRSALRQAIADQAVEDQTLEDARYCAAALLLDEHDLAESRAREMIQRGVQRQFLGLLSFRMVQLLLTGDRVVSLLKENTEHPFANYRLPSELVSEVARLLRADPMGLDRLRELMEAADELYMPMIASVLHAVDPQWRPRCDRRLYLHGAYLSEAKWRSIDLQFVNLAQADLGHSDLRDANLDCARLDRATLCGIHGESAHFAKVVASNADFGNADLCHADLSGGQFTRASFAEADLHDVVAKGADFGEADLKGANLRGAALEDCNFCGASLDDADLRDADLRGANLSEQVLRTAILRGANLERANLVRCDLEFVEWPHARMSATNLTDAYLTGSRMAGADLRQAKLNQAGLAEIDWDKRTCAWPICADAPFISVRLVAV